jgi:hypothetical protein
LFFSIETDMSANPLISSPAVHHTDAGQRRGALPTRGVWVWWHLLSLDAPTVAVVWCWFFASAFGLRLPWTASITLALGTWCVYVADRLLDGWRSIDMTDLRDRHWFYLRHRKPFVIAWVAAAVPLAYLILFRVPPAVRTDDIVLCVIGIGYFVLIHHRSVGHRFSKEMFVGFLFSISTAVPTWTRIQHGRGLLLAAICTFGAACWLNCVAIQTWEDAETLPNNPVTKPGHELQQARNARPTLTHFLGNHLHAFAIANGAIALLLASLPAGRALWPVFIAVTASSSLFLALLYRGGRFGALCLRVLADGALLTPLVFLIYLR